MSGVSRTVVRSSAGTCSAVHAIALDSRGSRSATESCGKPDDSTIRLIRSADPAVTSATDDSVRNGTGTAGEGSRPADAVSEARCQASVATSALAGSAALRPSASHSSYSRTTEAPKSMSKACVGARRT